MSPYPTVVSDYYIQKLSKIVGFVEFTNTRITEDVTTINAIITSNSLFILVLFNESCNFLISDSIGGIFMRFFYKIDASPSIASFSMYPETFVFSRFPFSLYEIVVCVVPMKYSGF